MIVVDEFIGK